MMHLSYNPEHLFGGGKSRVWNPLDEAALHRVHHGFEPLVGPELLVNTVQMIS